MTTALEQSFIDVVRKYGLKVFEVSMNLEQSTDARFSACVHWNGYTNTGHNCTHGYGPTIEAAIKSALDNAAKDRVQADTGPDFANAETLPAAA